MQLFSLIFIQTLCSTILALLYQNQFAAQKEFTYQPCDISMQQQSYSGRQIFSNSDWTLQSVNSLSLTGWFYLRGYNDTYTLYSAKYNSQILLGSTDIFSIGYDLTNSKIITQLYGQTISLVVPSLSRNTWYFFATTITYEVQDYKLLTTILDSNGIFYQQPLSQIFTSSQAAGAGAATNTGTSTPTQTAPTTQTIPTPLPPTQTQNLQPLYKSQIIVYIGYTDVTNGIQQTCSFSKSIYIYWDEVLNFASSYSNDVASLTADLNWNFDFFYSTANTGQLFNMAYPMNSLQIPINDAGPLQLKPGEYFLTDYINALEQNGFMIAFHFKVQSAIFTSIRLVQIIEGFSLSIDLLNGNTIQMNNQQIINVSFNQWIQVNLVIKYQSGFNVFLIVKGYENQVISTLISSFLMSQVKFGSENNIDIVEMRELRVYSGTFVTMNNSNDCYLQASRESISCVICDAQKLINYQGQINCQTASATNHSTDVNDVLDWTPLKSSCLPDMIRDNLTNECVCRYQFYREGNSCLGCPNYCRGCTDLQTCIENDPLRQSNGLCPDGYFDDGYLCINNKLEINSRVNLMKSFNIDLQPYCSPTLYTTNYDVNNLDLRITQQDTLFISFSFKSYLPSFQRGGIWIYKDGSREVFSVMYNRFTQPKVDFFVDGQVRHSILVNNNEAMWIGLWTDFSQAVFMVHSNAILAYKLINLGIMYSVNKPLISIGPVFTLYDNNYYCGNYNYRPELFIKNMQNPILDMQGVEDLISIQTQTLAYFQTDVNTVYNLGYIQDTATGVLLDFQGTPLAVSQLNGIEYISTTQSKISGLNLQVYWPTFSCQIFIESLQFQASLVSYEGGVSGKKVEYFIVPFGRNAFVRICFYNVCKDSEYALLKMNYHNSLFIITRLRSPFSPEISYVEFEIVCNYQRESIKFIDSIQLSQSFSTDINIGSQAQNVGSLKMYLNKISIDQGDGSYYFEYNQSDSCFIYKDITNMKCLLSKQGYVSYKTIFITEQECIQLTQLVQHIHILNAEARECIETNLDPSLCAEADLSEKSGSNTSGVQCLRCIYQNADVSNNCLCPDGTYPDFNQKICIPCSIQCLTCDTKQDNCLICKNDNQIAPSCRCADFKQYLDDNYVCQDCSYQCSSCEYDKDNCTDCSINRFDPPACYCQPSFTENNQVCEAIACSYQCATCSEQEQNCLRCNPGRVNPPQCDCDENTYEKIDGTCSYCDSSYFLDINTKTCLPCLSPCKECTLKSTQCTECIVGLSLKEELCYCPSGQSLTFSSVSQSVVCLEDMDVSFKLILRSNTYYLLFTFDYDLELINFQNININTLLSLHLQEISESLYTLSQPQIQNNQLYVKILFSSSIHTQSGTVYFQQNKQFMSRSERYVLSSSYVQKLMNFELGPFLLDQSVMEMQSLNDISSQLRQEKFDAVRCIQSTQFLFYFLNTAQPTLLFLLLNAQFPPNLYSFYQALGIYVYPDVADYQSKEYMQSFSLYGIQLNSTDATLNDYDVFKRLGFSKSLLINTQIIIVKYLCVFILIIILKIILNCKLTNSNLVTKITSFHGLLCQQINSENEANLLLVTVSILLQTTASDEESWPIRYGYYFSCLFVLIFLLSFYYNLKEINSKIKRNKQQFSYIFTSRLNQKQNILQRNYFLIQMVKKYLAIIILISFHTQPLFVCISNGALFFSSGLLTSIAQPYKRSLSRIIKIIGDYLLSLSWFMHIYILIIEQELYNETLLNDSLIQKYLHMGTAVIITLFAFNLIYLLEYLQSFYFIVITKCKKKNNQQDIVIQYLPTKSKTLETLIQLGSNDAKLQKLLAEKQVKPQKYSAKPKEVTFLIKQDKL